MEAGVTLLYVCLCLNCCIHCCFSKSSCHALSIMIILRVFDLVISCRCTWCSVDQVINSAVVNEAVECISLLDQHGTARHDLFCLTCD